MPRRNRGSGWGRAPAGSACPRRISRFLEPCLLLLLRESSTHGYDLLEALEEFGFARDALDASIVYRVLREMENAGWVTSTWQTAASGPARRVYEVTAEGEKYLAWWAADLQRASDEIAQFLELYRSQASKAGDS